MAQSSSSRETHLAKLIAYKLTEREDLVWTTQDGRKMRISEMDSQHIANAYVRFDKAIKGNEQTQRLKRDGVFIGQWLKYFKLELQLRAHEVEHGGRTRHLGRDATGI